MKPPKHILPLIVFSQFCCTSLWFAGNGVMDDLVRVFNLTSSSLGHLTSAVQFGFISGTLIFAVLSISDRFSPSKVFLACALDGALINLGMIWEGNSISSLLLLRFMTGFFLAGIYPVGMKIAADYFDKGLGKSLGYLVGALVVGTAFPHLLKGLTEGLPWKLVLISTTSLAAVGGLCIWLFVPDGPYRKASQKPDLSAFLKVFKKPAFRSASFGYFGHMWELYAFWAFVPVILSSYNEVHPGHNLNIPLLCFAIIGIGGLACVLGGYISMKVGTKKTAATALLLSTLCCLMSPALFYIDSSVLVISILLFWGMVVIADSPLFSTLVAQSAPAESKGTALTIVNCIGFSITILSIQLLTFLHEVYEPKFIFTVLAVGPVLGLVALREGKSQAK